MDGFIIEGDVLKKYTGDGGRVVIPEGIKVIGEDAFAYSCVTEVVLPRGLEKIGNRAFSSCSDLTDITVPKSVTAIGIQAFSYCISLEQAVIEGNCVTFSGGAFKECCKLKIVQLPEGLLKLEEAAFLECVSLEYIYLPDSLEYIDESVFAGCVSLKEVDIPAGITKLSGVHFAPGFSITGFRVADGNKYFKVIDGNLYSKSGDTLVRYAAGKTDAEFYLPYHVKNIDDGAFSNAWNLKRIFLHEGVKRIGEGAFSGCSITEIEIPRCVEYIREMTFSGCKELRSVKLPDTLREIGKNAFDYCSSLVSIVIPKSVERMGSNVFSRCSDLIELTVLTDKIEPLWIFECRSLRSIYVPSQELAERILFDRHYFCAMRGFLIRYYEQKTTAEEADGWVAYVLNHKLKCVEKLGEEMLFWRFVLEREIFSAEDVRTYVDLVTALECRAFLFKYLNECDSEVQDGEA